MKKSWTVNKNVAVENRKSKLAAKGTGDPDDDDDDEPEEEAPVEPVPEEVREPEEKTRDAPKVAKTKAVEPPLDPYAAWVAGKDGPPLISREEMSKATIHEQHHGANNQGYQGNE